MTSNPSSPSLRPKPLDALVAAAVIALTVVTALLFYAPKTGAGPVSYTHLKLDSVTRDDLMTLTADDVLHARGMVDEPEKS